MKKTEGDNIISIPKPGLRIVHICDLEPVKDKYSSSIYKKEVEQLNDLNHLIPDQISNWSDRRKYDSKILAYYKNIEINHCCGGTLLDAFKQAYNNHEDITLFPDDVWMTILFQFSKYINDNAEKLRNKFVNFEGKKELIITTENDLKESEWEEFFELMIKAIKENTKDGIVSEMQCNFSTTGLVEKMMSTATVMDSFKKYFSYGRMIPMCGIRNVCFGGTLVDWESVHSKLVLLNKYDVDGKWNSYITNLEPIIVEFINTYNGNVNTVFWDKVMNLKSGRLGSGSTIKISGWILSFYGLTGQCIDVGDVNNEYIIDVPVKINNKITKIVKNVRLRGTFAGLNKTNGSYRPQMSMIICELEKDNMSLNKEEDWIKGIKTQSTE